MMPLRRFAARAIGSGTDPFRSARWKLTLIYTAILAAIVAILSAALYEFHAHDVRAIEPRRPRPSIEGSRDDTLPGPLVVEPPGVGEYLERLGRSIILADIITVLAGAGLSALLAGMTLRPIRRAVEAEKAFFANAAHDLRTPLAVMRSEAEVALRAGNIGAAEARQVVESSLEEIGHMSAMVEQMLDLARRGRRTGTAELVPLDLAALARDAVERMAGRAAEKGVCLRAEAQGVARIRGDSLALQRAVGNVLENALAYTARGGTVVVRVQRAPGHVVLSVEDNGIGIEEQDLPHIAEPFYRGDRARSVHDGGAGLGLTIVESTMGEHGGTLHAVSHPGAGTTIALRFPAHQH